MVSIYCVYKAIQKRNVVGLGQRSRFLVLTKRSAASGDVNEVVVDMFHKSIQYALEKLGKSKSGFERTVVSKFKRKRRVGSGNELVDYSRAPCLGADQKARGLWERDWVDSNRSRPLPPENEQCGK